MAGKRGTAIKAFLKRPPVHITLKILGSIGKCLLTILLIGVITVSLVGCVMVVYVVNTFDGSQNLPDLEELNRNETSIIYTKKASSAGDDDEWTEFLRLEGTNKVWKALDEIPSDMANAVIAIEDERFNEHYGVDWKRTISAFANLVFHFSDNEYGGSTITQQLIKVTTGNDDHRIERKITEIMSAVYMEQNRATKSQILEAYLNVLPLSDNITGVGAAANYFFGKDIKDLSIAECALIAGLTKNPSLYSPYAHPENARKRQRLVLYKMNELGMITDDEYRQAYGEELHFKSSVKRVAVMDYYTDLLIEDVIADLMDQYGYTRNYATNLLYYGGLNIYSAEQPDLQKRVEAIYANDKNYPAVIASDKENPQTALFVIDYNGRVVATIGQRGEKTANRLFNRSTQSMRQPGSSMKPVGVYSKAIELNIAYYSSLVRDAPITLENGKQWPGNYSSGEPVIKDRGTTLLNSALRRSVNTVAVRLLEEVTPKVSFDFLTRQLHLTTLVKSYTDDTGTLYTDIDRAPLALGGLTHGVYAREMAAAYQIFGNGGQYNEPFTYYAVSQRDGQDSKEILKKTPMTNRALDEDTAYVMNRLLQEVMFGPNGTAAGLKGSWTGWGVFSKTGTTSDNKDVYYVGGTPYYVAASWFGYDGNKSLNSRQTGYARSLWNKAMVELHKGLTPAQFTQKGNTVEKEYCTSSGMLATAACPSKGIGVYKLSNIPGTCTQHGGGASPATTAGKTASAGTGSTSGASTTGGAASTAPASTASMQ